MRALLLALTALAPALPALLWALPAFADPPVAWTGRHYAKGGSVIYTEQCGIECAEAYSIEVICNELTRNIELTVVTDAPAPENSMVPVHFQIDGQWYQFDGFTGSAGMFPPSPSAVIAPKSSFIKSLMEGLRFSVYVGQTSEPSWSGDLLHTRRLFARYLAACL